MSNSNKLDFLLYYKEEDFYRKNVKPIESLEDSFQELEKFKEGWVFRGQQANWHLRSYFERSCDGLNLELEDCPRTEEQMIRDFQRKYDGPDRLTVVEDTLYCMALMQHHGAPTRLLDWTYSPFIATYNALKSLDGLLESKGNSNKDEANDIAVWCLKEDSCIGSDKAKKEHLELQSLICCRNKDECRNDTSFKPLYMEDKYDIVLLENPFLLNMRLNIQQGVFLCPGKISVPLEEILRKESPCLVKLVWRGITREQRREAFEKLHRMNINEASLYPGLDGFARSMKYNLSLYKKLADKWSIRRDRQE